MQERRSNTVAVLYPLIRTMQQAFFPKKQQQGETLQEFSLALIALTEQEKQRAPDAPLNAGVSLGDQFVKPVFDSVLCRELKQLVSHQSTTTLLELCA